LPRGRYNGKPCPRWREDVFTALRADQDSPFFPPASVSKLAIAAGPALSARGGRPPGIPCSGGLDARAGPGSWRTSAPSHRPSCLLRPRGPRRRTASAGWNGGIVRRRDRETSSASWSRESFCGGSRVTHAGVRPWPSFARSARLGDRILHSRRSRSTRAELRGGSAHPTTRALGDLVHVGGRFAARFGDDPRGTGR